jgi:hypothetical protein
MQIEGLISIALTFVTLQENYRQKMVHSSYPTQKMFAEGGTGSKHVDSNKLNAH